MPTKHTWRRSVGAMIGTAMALGAAAGVSAQDAQPVHGGTLKVGFTSDVKTLDPTHSVQFSERQVLYPIYNTLVRFGPDFSIQPELAGSWTIENDGKRLLLHLRSGVKFHDGSDLDANSREQRLLTMLDAISRSLSGALSVPDAIAEIAGAAGELLKFERMAVLKIESEETIRVHAAVRGIAWQEGQHYPWDVICLPIPDAHRLHEHFKQQGLF